MNLNLLPLGFFAAAQLFAQVAYADTVYSWTDAEGITHFSDNPPERTDAGSLPEVETMAMPAGFSDVSAPQEDYYSITNQWQRMQQERSQREQLSLQRQQARIDSYRVRERASRADAANRAATETAPSYVLPNAGYPRYSRHPGPSYGASGQGRLYRRSLGYRGGHSFRGHRARPAKARGHDEKGYRQPPRQQHYLGNQSVHSKARSGGGVSFSITKPGFSLRLNRD